MNFGPGKKLPASAVCERYDISRRALGRWMVDKTMKFPEPITINGRHYFDEAEIAEFERRSVSKLGKAA